MKNYYEILKVDEKADDNEIKKAYRREVKECHTDTHPNNPVAENRLREINEAYDVLSDPLKKKKYDSERFLSSEIKNSTLTTEKLAEKFFGFLWKK